MTRQAIIDNTIKAINLLPQEMAVEISDFAEFMSKKYEEQILIDGLHKLASESDAFSFLNDEEDIYSVKDLKEKYNA